MLSIYIDSSRIEDITVKLSGSFGEEIIVKETKDGKGSQVILSVIEKILKKKEKSLEEITAVAIYVGPGSFTGLRVGAAIANTLSYALSLPINNNEKGKFVYPTYR